MELRAGDMIEFRDGHVVVLRRSMCLNAFRRVTRCAVNFFQTIARLHFKQPL